MRQEIPGTFHLGSFEGVFRTLGNKDASGEFPRLPPQETAGVGGKRRRRRRGNLRFQVPQNAGSLTKYRTAGRRGEPAFYDSRGVFLIPQLEGCPLFHSGSRAFSPRIVFEGVLEWIVWNRRFEIDMLE